MLDFDFRWLKIGLIPFTAIANSKTAIGIRSGLKRLVGKRFYKHYIRIDEGLLSTISA
jgi:hypothetical protein